MSLETCSRCGTETQSPVLLCPVCTGWLDEQTHLDEATVVDAMEFNPTPVPDESPVQLALAAPALPLFLEALLAGVVLVATVWDPTFYAQHRPASALPFFLYVASAPIVFGNLALGAFKVRTRPLYSVVLSGSVALGLTGIPILLVLALMDATVIADLAIFMILRTTGVVAFVIPLGFALDRQRKLKAARGTLIAYRESRTAASGQH